MPEGKPQIYLSAKTKRALKARAAIEGMSLMSYLEELEKKTAGLLLEEIQDRCMKKDRSIPATQK